MTAISRLTNALADRYAIEGEIGRGGMATVYVARDLKHERKVALKVLDPELGAVLGPERFLSEIRVTANLQHPNILPLFDSGECEGLLYYVMPFVDGESLGVRLEREQQLPIDEAIRIATAVAGALDYAHRQNVIHRDLKPHNILMREGQPLVADFGIALAVSNAGAGRITQTGLSLGTPQYMSPEQATGDRVIDGRSDIYSLGAVTYEMLAGEPPHTGGSSQAIIAKVITERPRSLRLARDRVPVHVEQAIDRALAKLAADRFATAQEFADALSGRLAPDSHPVVPADTPRRSKKGVALIVGAALIAIGTAYTLGAAHRIAADATPRRFTITLPDSAPFLAGHDFVDAISRALTISHDGQSVVYSAQVAAGTRLMLARLDLGTITPLRGTEGATLPTFSPDGRAIAFEVNGGLRRLVLDGETLTSMGEPGWTDGLLWDNDGRIYGSSHAACFWAVAAGGGSITKVAPEACAVRLMSPITNSEWMLFDADRIVSIVSRKTHAIKRVRSMPGASRAEGLPLSGDAPFMVARGILAFTRDSTIYAARFDEASLRLLSEPQAVVTGVRSDASGAHAALAEDGTFVWASGGDGTLSRFVWVTRDGVVRDTLFVGPTPVWSYVLSADGNRIAYSTRSPTGAPLLYVASIDRRVVDEVKTTVELLPLNWIDHDRKLVAELVRPDGSSRMAVVTWPQGTASIDTSEAPFETESRDGSRRCLAMGNHGVDVWKTAAPIQRTRLQQGPGGYCRFSPDGKRLVWGGDGLFVAQTDSDGARTRTQLVTVGDEPQWTADGKQVVYRDGNRWFAVDAPVVPAATLAVPRLIARGHFLQADASWAMATDGRLLLLASHEQPPARQLQVLTHFPAFVEQKLRGAK